MCEELQIKDIDYILSGNEPLDFGNIDKINLESGISHVLFGFDEQFSHLKGRELKILEFDKSIVNTKCEIGIFIGYLMKYTKAQICNF